MKRNTPSPATVIKRAKLDGFSGSCLAAAIAINDVVFAGKGKIVAAFNEHQWNKRSKLMGHFAVEFNGEYWDADGRAKPWEEIESWGQIDQFGHGRKLSVNQANNTIKLYFDDSSMTNDYGLRISDVMDIFYNSKLDLVKEMSAKLRGSVVKHNPPSPGFNKLSFGHYATAYRNEDRVEVIVNQNKPEPAAPFPYYDASREIMIAVRAAAPDRLKQFLPDIIRKRIDWKKTGEAEFIYEMPFYDKNDKKLKYITGVVKPTDAELQEIATLIRREAAKYPKAVFGFDSDNGTIENLDPFNMSIYNGVLILRDPIAVCMMIPEFMRTFSGNFRRENQVARYLQTAIR